MASACCVGDDTLYATRPEYLLRQAPMRAELRVDLIDVIQASHAPAVFAALRVMPRARRLCARHSCRCYWIL